MKLAQSMNANTHYCIYLRKKNFLFASGNLILIKKVILLREIHYMINAHYPKSL